MDGCDRIQSAIESALNRWRDYKIPKRLDVTLLECARASACSPAEMIPRRGQRDLSLSPKALGSTVSSCGCDGEEHVEENTSKVYVGPAASLLNDPLLAATGAGSSLFVINLCASIAPIPVTGKTIPGLESYRLYQVARNEDGRTRHRLRLGFFTSEEDAERALAVVRNSYPTAFTTCLSSDDRKFARGFIADTAPATPAWKRPVAVEAVPTKAAQPPAASTAPIAAVTAAPTAAPKEKIAASPGKVMDLDLSWEPQALQARAPEAKKTTAPPAATSAQTSAPDFQTAPAIKSKSAETLPTAAVPAAAKIAPAIPAATIELTLAAETAAATPEAAPINASTQPFHVGKGVEIPAMSLSLDTQILQATAPTAAKPEAATTAAAAKAVAAKETTAKTPAAPVNKPLPTSVAPTSMAAPARPTTPARLAVDLQRPMPELDSTQTIRALTSAELGDDSQEKWFAIQLAVSEQPVNLDAMPHLDIFEAYRLYSVANAGSGKIVHSLRIGFFREQVSAEAVCGYLKTFFASPSVLRISAAEQLRFKDATAPKVSAGARNDAKVIELNHARDRVARPTIPTVTMEVAAPHSAGADRSPTGSFKANATGTFKTGASGSYKMNTTGSHKALNPTLKPAARSAGVATKRSATPSRASSTGKYKALPKKSLGEQLLDEAREVELSESAIRKLPKSDSLLSRLVGKLTK